MNPTQRRWTRRFLGSGGILRQRPREPGITTGRVAGVPRGEQDLSAMATSPTTYAAINARALSLVTYPIRVYSGFGIGGKRPELVDPERRPWAADLLRLLQTPDIADLAEDALFPQKPGESMLAQVIADLLMTGNAFVPGIEGAGGRVVGLDRLHPRSTWLERRGGVGSWLYKPGSGARPERYKLRSVAHLRLLSWQASGAGLMGTGAGASLAPLVAAESAALRQTAQVVEQGGADIALVGKDAQTVNWLKNKQNREKVVSDATTAMRSADGRRVFAIGGNFDLQKAGFDPADLKAPELLSAARVAELMALGCTPVLVGSESSTYSTAVQQMRVQYLHDLALAYTLEIFLLRPLARRFARCAGGRQALRSERVTCRIDLSGHPGAAYLRTDAMTRMEKLVGMGWSPGQAAESEGLDLPEPEGPPRTRGADEGKADPNKPRRPVGDAENDPDYPGDGEEPAEPSPRIADMPVSEWLREQGVGEMSPI